MDSFNDILEPRRQERSNFLWVSRKLNTSLAYKQCGRPKPDAHKKEVLRSERIKEFIEKTHSETGTSIPELEHQVKLILDEIGFNKQLKIIRWLGLVLTKICQKIYTGIHVNEDSIQRLKSVMGNCPVIFAPSHRSYADFILMSYVCFTYDIEIPAIAAGMDFHGMWGMGSILRDTGAFFMRRSYNDDALYWETFKQYIHQIITKGDLPIEFFIEGTRSRSCKSLVPKFGLLSMILKPLFTREVPDVLIVPINISYDRVLEEKLFAFELLGIPKPKESTSGFLKSLSIIKEHFGNIYVDFTSPISVKQYFGDTFNIMAAHSMGPVHQQHLTNHDREFINDLGYKVLRVQRAHATIMPFNLAALSIQCLKSNSLSSLASDMSWLRNILQQLGARVTLESLDESLKVHGNLLEIHGDEIKIVQTAISLDNIDPKKLKGYKLTNETMSKIIPTFMLQLYINPCLHYFTDCCMILIAILAFGRNAIISKDELFGHYRFLRTIYSYEFVFYDKMEQMEFDETLKKLEYLNVIEMKNDYFSLTNNKKLQVLLLNLLSPFISSYFCICRMLQNVPDSSAVEHTAILTEAQKQMEISLENDQELHPYCLSLDTLSICLQSYTTLGVLNKYKEADQVKYKVNEEKLNFISDKFDQITTTCAKFGKKTSSIYSPQFTAKL